MEQVNPTIEIELEGLEEVLYDGKKDGFVIDDFDKADWAIRVYNKATKRQEDLKEMVDKRIQMLKDYLENALKEQEDIKDRMAMLLKPFVEQEIKGQKKKSIKLINGTVGFREQQPKFNLDNEKVLAFAKSSFPEYVKVTEKVDWEGLKKKVRIEGERCISEDGEVIEGIEVTQETPKFYIKQSENKEGFIQK